jgi:hypothetical protein
MLVHAAVPFAASPHGVISRLEKRPANERYECGGGLERRSEFMLSRAVVANSSYLSLGACELFARRMMMRTPSTARIPPYVSGCSVSAVPVCDRFEKDTYECDHKTSF